MEQKIFYYHFKKFNLWTVLNILMSFSLVFIAFSCPCALYMECFRYGLFVFAISWLLWGYKYIHRQVAVIISEDGIKIDHCAVLAWKDIDGVTEKTVRCGMRNCRVAVLLPKEGVEYHYNFLQKHNPFPPFSIPLYDIIAKYDEETILSLLKEKLDASKIDL